MITRIMEVNQGQTPKEILKHDTESGTTTEFFVPRRMDYISLEAGGDRYRVTGVEICFNLLSTTPLETFVYVLKQKSRDKRKGRHHPKLRQYK